MKDVIIRVLVLPGGAMPAQGRTGDSAYDVTVRAIVRKEMDKDFPFMRETVWDLTSEPADALFSFAKYENGHWHYVLYPGESVFVGLGIVLGGYSSNWFAELAPRSSTAIRKISVKNHLDGVPIDPNFRAEPIALLTNESDQAILVYQGWKPAQLKFFCTCCRGRGFLRPELIKVSSLKELGKTNRQNGWNGSSNGLIQTELKFATG